MEMPVFVNRYCNVWGLTAMFTNAFLQALYPHHQKLSTFRYLPDIEKTHINRSPFNKILNATKMFLLRFYK